jgi:alkyl hydroperoxide reductase subunit AhpC
VLSDPERSVYHSYGLDKAFIFIQRTASVVVDSKGAIQYLKLAYNPMTWLQESQELLRVVQNLPKTEKPVIS